MRSLIAFTVNELRVRKTLFFLAAGFATFVFLAPAVIPMLRVHGSDVRLILAVTLSLGYGWVLAVLLGATLIANDLAEGRSSFVFSRPASGPAIFFGKLAGLYLLILTCMSIVALPALMMSGQPTGLEFLSLNPVLFAILFFAVPLFLLNLCNCISIAVRAHTSWLLLDAAAILVFVILLRVAFARVFPPNYYPGDSAVRILLGTSFLVLFVGFVIAGAVQVSCGRASLNQGHRLLSLSLAPFLVVAGLATTGLAKYFSKQDLADIKKVVVAASAREGSWIHVTGRTGRPDSVHSLLLEVKTGRHIYLSNPSEQFVKFSGDGSVALTCQWLKTSLCELVYIDLDQEHPEKVPTGIFLDGRKKPKTAVSPTGGVFAHFSDSTIHAFEVPEGRRVATVDFTRLGEIEDLLISDENTVRLFSKDIRHTEDEAVSVLNVYDIDLPSQVKQLRSSVPYPTNSLFLNTGDMRVLVSSGPLQDDNHSWSVVDVSSGATSDFAPFGDGRRLADVFSDGTAIFFINEIGEPATVAQIGADGEILRVVELDTIDRLVNAVESGRNTALVWLQNPDLPAFQADRCIEIDFETGSIRRVGESIRPIPGAVYFEGSRSLYSSCARLGLLTDRESGLLVWDRESGEIRQLLGG
jgi:hypothetical protein